MPPLLPRCLSLVCWVLAATAALAEPAGAQSAAAGRQRFDAALHELRQGSPRTAAAAFSKAAASLAAEDPELAAEALFRAAQLHDEKLSEPALAAPLYAQVAHSYPRSRLAARARQRAVELSTAADPDPEAQAEFNQLAAAYQTLGSPALISRLTKLLAEHPRFAQADRATYLLGVAYRLAGPHSAGAAAAALRRVLSDYPGSAWRPYAQRTLAELALERGDYAAASRLFDELQRYPQPLWQQTAHEGQAACRRVMWRRRAAQACWVYLMVAGAALALLGRRQLLPPPMEVLYYTPVAAFLTSITLFGPAVHARTTMAALAISGSLFCWLSGAAARRRQGLIPGLLLRALAIAAVCYLAVYHGGLLSMVIETWRSGPESG